MSSFISPSSEMGLFTHSVDFPQVETIAATLTTKAEKILATLATKASDIVSKGSDIATKAETIAKTGVVCLGVVPLALGAYSGWQLSKKPPMPPPIILLINRGGGLGHLEIIHNGERLVFRTFNIILDVEKGN